MFRPRRLWWLFLTGLMLGLAGCRFNPTVIPPAVVITAPQDGDLARAERPIQVTVHLHERVPTGQGTLHITGPEEQELPLLFERRVTGLYVAEAGWIPTLTGEYTLRARVPTTDGDEESAAVTIQVVTISAIRRAPMLAGEAPAENAPRPAATPTPTSAAQATTPAPSGSPTPTPTPSPTPLPCLRAEFVADVTVPDGTTFDPGAAFTKTWRLRNTGSCTWTPDFAVVFDSGDRMDAPDATPIGQTVAPGQMVDVSVALTAPAEPGTYRANFKLRSTDGRVFGLGHRNAAFYVEIRVQVRLPDLQIQAISFDPATPVAGQGFTVYVTVVNRGEARSGSFAVIWQTDPNAHVPYCSWQVNDLAPDNTTTLSCPAGRAENGYLPAGQYTTVAIADAGQDVAESNEDNNEATAPLHIVSGDTQGPGLKPSASSNKIYWPTQYCTPYEVTIRTHARDESGVAWVRLTYRVVDDTGKVGQWVTRDMTLTGTDIYSYTLTAADLEASLNPPVRSGQGRVEYYITAADTVGNTSRVDMPALQLLYCVY